MTKLRPETVYRSVDLVFDTNLESTLASVAERVKSLFDENKFRHATLVVDIRNPSNKPMFK